MKLSLLFSIAALYMSLVALGYIFAPLQFGIDAVPPDAPPELVAYLRLFGSPLLGIAVMDWLVRHARPSPVLDAVIIGNIVGFAAIGLMDVWGLFSGARPQTKIFVAIHLGFALAFVLAGRKHMTSRTASSNT